MSNFMDNMKGTLNNEYNVSVTENGAVGYRTSGKALLDLNFSVASLRHCTDADISTRFYKAFFEDRMAALKWLFYARDVRGGLGERRLFRTCMLGLANDHPDLVIPLIPLIPEYGRWDDLWELLETPVHDTIVRLVNEQLSKDVNNWAENRPISLLAKWMPRCKTSSACTRHRAQILRKSLGMTERQYQHTIADLSRYLVVVEQQMSKGGWNEIDYQRVPSRANLIYNSAFLRHDEERRRDFLSKLEKGEVKINAGTLFPHDIVHKYMDGERWGSHLKSYDATLEGLWKHLPDTVNGCGNTIVVADGSGSMTSPVSSGGGVTALDVANALAIYFAERSSGQFKDQYITFSQRPQLVDLSGGKTLHDKIRIALLHDEVANTNVEAVFDLILTTAINHHMEQSELPANILIISDMEFDGCACTNAGRRGGLSSRLFDMIAQKYANAGYKLPRLVFWNVNSRTGTIPVKENNLGVALVSGFSVNVVNMVMSGKLDPYECLLEAINTERYQPVEDALRPCIPA